MASTLPGVSSAASPIASCSTTPAPRSCALTRKTPRSIRPSPRTRRTDPKVHPDHHVQIARSLYSVPTKYIGKKLRARVDKKTVRLYLHGELIKVHARVAPGKRSTDLSDYPVGKAPYASRSVDAI